MLALASVEIARGGRTLLSDVTIAFAPGTFTAIVGANGVGKSSLLETMCGATPPVTGIVMLGGVDIATVAPRIRARAIALVEPSEPVLSSMTVAEAVASARFPHHRWWEWEASAEDEIAIGDALRRTALLELRARTIGTLSAGERQRVWIAVALAQRARIVALDEPTTHLDLRYAIETLALLRSIAQNGATVVAVLHALEEAATADRVIVLAGGRVLADGAPGAALTAANLEAAFGVRIGVTQSGNHLTFDRTMLDAR